MLAHKDRFDDKLMRERSETAGGLPVGGDSSKVRLGNVASYKPELSQELLAELDAIWQDRVAREHGLASYDEAARRLV